MYKRQEELLTKHTPPTQFLSIFHFFLDHNFKKQKLKTWTFPPNFYYS